MPIRAGKYIWTTGCIELVPKVIFGTSEQKLRAKQLIRSMLYSLRADSLTQRISIDEHAHCIHGAGFDFTGLHTALLAHFDPDNNIDQTLIKQCKHLKNLGYKIIVCTSSKQSAKKALECMQEFVHAIIYRTCAGYDFTSWKAAFALFPSLWDSSELILTNDSYFGPLSLKGTCNSFAPMHERMQDFACDFWGISFSWQQVPHIQSYYIVLKTRVLQSKALQDFFAAVPLCSKRKTAISQELSFALWLVLHDFKPAAFCFAHGSSKQNINPSLHGHEIMLKRGVSLIKREAVRSPHGFTTLLKYSANQQTQSSLTTHDNVQFNENFLQIEQYFLRVQKNPNTERGIGQHGAHFPPHVTAKFLLLEFNNATYHAEPSAQQSIAVCLHVARVDDLLAIKQLQYLPKNTNIYAFVHQHHELLPKALVTHNIKILPSKDAPLIALLCHAHLLEQHSLILQLHINNLSLPELASSGFEKTICKRWESHIYASLLGNEGRIKNIIQSFMQNTKLGCIAPVLYPAFARTTQNEHANMLQYMAKKLGFELNPNIAIDYPLGAMFWASMDMLKPLVKLYHEHGEQLQASYSSKQLNIALEKMVFMSCALQDMQWSRIGP